MNLLVPKAFIAEIIADSVSFLKGNVAEYALSSLNAKIA
jgi:hypothetical protein